MIIDIKSHIPTPKRPTPAKPYWEPKFDVGDLIRNVSPYPGEAPYIIHEICNKNDEYICYQGPSKHNGLDWDLDNSHIISSESEEFMELIDNDRIALSEVWNKDE